MADEEHLAILKRGIPGCNRWREENPDAVPDLEGADLHKANLGKANLSQAKLSNGILREAKLNQAEFSGQTLARPT